MDKQSNAQLPATAVVGAVPTFTPSLWSDSTLT